MASETALAICTSRAPESKPTFSPFFTLPAEIRNQIYEIVLEDSRNHDKIILLSRPFPYLPKLTLTCRAIQADMMPMILGRRQCIFSLMIDATSWSGSFAALVHPYIENWMRRNVLSSQCIYSLQIQFGYPGALDIAFDVNIDKDEKRQPVVEIRKLSHERRSGPSMAHRFAGIPLVFKRRYSSARAYEFMVTVRELFESRLAVNCTGLVGVEELDTVQRILKGCCVLA